MNASRPSLVPLQHASLCMDCEMITAAHTHCSACGSAALLNLARTLNGGDDFIPMHKALATVASTSEGQSSESRQVSVTPSRRPYPVAACVPFSPISSESAAEAKELRWRYPLREITSALQRVMTIAVVGILALGAAIEARDRSADIVSPGSTLTRIYSRLRR